MLGIYSVANGREIVRPKHVLERVRVMKTLRLGRTEFVVSRVGFGGIPVQRCSENGAIEVVRRCLDLGITFFDTANGYSTSEERIGKALSDRRTDVVIATKSAARDKKTAREHLELSLKRLNTDYLDLWQLHNVSSPEVYEQVLEPGGAMEAAQEALEAGKIRHIGISSHSMEVALQAVASDHFETIQFPFNFVTDEPKEELIPLAQKHDVGFIAMKPFAGGMLGDATPAMKFLLQYPTVLPDPGVEQVSQIEEIVDIVNGRWELSPQERQEIERIRAEVGTRFCRRCGYCQPCPQAVQIPVLMNLESFLKRFPVERIVQGWVAEAMESGRNCVQCGECEERCPYELPIREMLAENLEAYDRLTPEPGA